jgi:hypothetical protein
MQTDKQKWIEEVLSSTDGAGRAPAPDMTDTALSRIGTANSTHIVHANNNSLIWRIAATVLLLLLLNALTLYSYQSNITKTRHAIQEQAAAADFGLSQNDGTDPGLSIFGK